MHTEQWLKAGGYVLPTWETANHAVDKIDARSFVHPGLPGREVVRLTPDSLAIGEDSAMGLLGFELANSVEGVALRVRQALGFPDWILVYHAKDAKLALSTARNLKKLMRGAKSKPGNAKDMVTALGKSLEKTHPHFLPALYEEIARMFIEAGNTTYASTFFGKARESEQMYALEVDEERRRDAFVEFALNGALTNKVMTEYAKVLSANHGAEKAYEYFFDLCVRRTLGGTPVSAQMVTDLRKLAKAAKKKPAEEDARFVAEIWESPALSFSAGKFWEAYAGTYKALAGQLSGLKGRLLNLWPRPSSGGKDFKEFWINFLGDVGALEALTTLQTDKIPDGDKPEGSVANWYQKLLEHRMETGYGGWNTPDMPDVGFELLRKLAPRLKQEEVPVALRGNYQRGDADVLDLALELGVPVMADESTFRLDVWMNAPEDSKERLRHLEFIAKDKRFNDILDDAVGNVFPNLEFQKAAAGKRGLAEARRKWLVSRAEGMKTAFGPGWFTMAGALASVPPQAVSEFPSAYQALSEFDPVPALTRSARLGLMAELGWPELEEAKAEISQGNSAELQLSYSFPYVFVYNQRKVIAVGPKGREAEHDFLFKSTGHNRIRALRFVNGQFLVAFYDDSWSQNAYWSGKPKDIFDWTGWHSNGATCVLDDGRIFEGTRAFGPPDQEMPGSRAWVSDGETFWRQEGWYQNAHLIEIDPHTGRDGRKSLPKFFEEFAQPGYRLELHNSKLYPVPANLNSLFGAKGLWGVRARVQETSQTYEFETLTGDRSSSWILGTLTYPGATTKSEITTSWEHLNADGHIVSQYASPPNHEFFHFFGWRDPEASKRLRGLEESTVASWFVEGVLERLTAAERLPTGMSDETLLAFLNRLEAHGASRERLEVLRKCIEGTKANATSLQDAIRSSLGNCEPSLANELAQVVHQFLSQADRIGVVVALADPTQNVAQVPLSQIMPNLPLISSGYYSYYHDKVEMVHLLSHLQDVFEGAEVSQDRFHYIAGEFIASMLQPESIYWCAARQSDREAFTSLMNLMAETINLEGVNTRVSYLPPDPDGSLIQKIGMTNGVIVSKFARGAGHVLVIRLSNHKFSYVVFEWSKEPIGDLGVEVVLSEDWKFPTPDTLKSWAERLRGPAEIVLGSEPAQAVSEASGVSFAEAGLLWANGPNWSDWNTNFLPKELREQLGLKVKEASDARNNLRSLVGIDFVRVCVEAIRLQPDPFDPSAATALGEAWGKVHGERAVVDEVLKEALGHLQGLYLALTDRKSGIWVDPKFEVEPASQGFQLNITGLHGGSLTSYLQLILQLGFALPSGHAARKIAQEAGMRIREVLKDENLVVPVGSPYGYAYGEEERDKQLQMLGIQKGKLLDSGVTLAYQGYWSVEVLVRIARYLKGETNEHLKVLGDNSTLKQIQYFNSDEFLSYLNALDKTWEGCLYDPSQVVPELVETVSKELKLSPTAATLFLQTLALPELKTTDVKTWNGWSTKVYNAACDELTKAKLVVEAKRARAGRSHFLDGPWFAIKSGNLPIEGWKAPFFDLQENGYAPLGMVPRESMPQFFRSVWKRFASGDRPGF